MANDMSNAELIIRVLDAAADRSNEDNENPEIAKYVVVIKETYRIERSRTDFQTASRLARIAAVQMIVSK